MRAADVIVCTSIGSADPRLLAACGIVTSDDEYMKERGLPKKTRKGPDDIGQRPLAPDGLTPLATPFVLIDEACQSVEPATLVPLFATNSCQSLVMLGDPCQLPPTILSDTSSDGSSPLSVSLMGRLAASLPQPVIVTAKTDKTPKEERYLNLKLTKQAVSLVKRRGGEEGRISYRKKFSGSLLLTVQYRMHASIAAFSSAVFYDSLLSTPESLTGLREFPYALAEILPLYDRTHNVRFVNVGGRHNEERDRKFSTVRPLRTDTSSLLADGNTSFSNSAEALQILHLLKGMMMNEMMEPVSVGIVTPYSSQVILIKSLMASDPEFRSLLADSNVTIEVNSVDAYQGRERDLIFFSSVRSNRLGNIGFLRDWR
jgi:superfamily I DNA and/or RNA helicase